MWIDDGRLTIDDFGGMRIDAQGRVDSDALRNPLAAGCVGGVLHNICTRSLITLIFKLILI